MAETVKNFVGAMRLEHGFTQEEFAIKVGVTRQTIISIEKGGYIPSVLLALKIAKAFGVPVEEIFKIQK